jgi:hypothetical protein
MSYWVRATADVNATSISLMSMAPPYTPYATGGNSPVLFHGNNSWVKYSVLLVATETASDGRLGWFWATPWVGPDSVDIYIANVSLVEVRRTNPNSPAFNADVGNLLFFGKGQVRAHAVCAHLSLLCEFSILSGTAHTRTSGRRTQFVMNPRRQDGKSGLLLRC